MKKLIVLFVFLAFICACRSYKKDDDTEARAFGITHITKNMIWQNEVLVRGTIQIEKGAKLKVLSGTKVEFARGAGLIVYGDILAEGKDPIIWTSAGPVKNKNDWQGIYIEGSNNSLLKNCIVEYAYKAIHIHSSFVVISRCKLQFNEGAIHFTDSNIMLDRNYICNNVIGLRVWNSSPVVTLNTIAENQTGIFCAEGIKNMFIQKNNIYQNSEYNIALGESQKENIDALNNYWGTADFKDIEKKIYDKSDSEYIGKVVYSPFSDYAQDVTSGTHFKK